MALLFYSDGFMKNLTETQKNILNYIIYQKTKAGITPTLAEIANKFGYKNRATVQQHLQAIERKGFLKRKPKLSRSLELNIQDKFFVSTPVIGEVAAGNPITIYPDSIDTIQLPTIAYFPNDSFLLKVKGDSLKDAFIFSNDVVIVNPNLEVKNGKFVVAILNDAAVVKRYYKTDGKIELRSENPEYQTIRIDENFPAFSLVGVVIGIYRSLERQN